MTETKVAEPFGGLTNKEDNQKVDENSNKYNNKKNFKKTRRKISVIFFVIAMALFIFSFVCYKLDINIFDNNIENELFILYIYLIAFTFIGLGFRGLVFLYHEYVYESGLPEKYKKNLIRIHIIFLNTPISLSLSVILFMIYFNKIYKSNRVDLYFIIPAIGLLSGIMLDSIITKISNLK